jgi:hypothetical protein
MIDRSHTLPLTRQARVLRISRGSVYYLPKPVSANRDIAREREGSRAASFAVSRSVRVFALGLVFKHRA